MWAAPPGRGESMQAARPGNVPLTGPSIGSVGLEPGESAETANHPGIVDASDVQGEADLLVAMPPPDVEARPRTLLQPATSPCRPAFQSPSSGTASTRSLIGVGGEDPVRRARGRGGAARALLRGEEPLGRSGAGGALSFQQLRPDRRCPRPPNAVHSLPSRPRHAPSGRLRDEPRSLARASSACFRRACSALCPAQRVRGEKGEDARWSSVRTRVTSAERAAATTALHSHPLRRTASGAARTSSRRTGPRIHRRGGRAGPLPPRERSSTSGTSTGSRRGSIPRPRSPAGCPGRGRRRRCAGASSGRAGGVEGGRRRGTAPPGAGDPRPHRGRGRAGRPRLSLRGPAGRGRGAGAAGRAHRRSGDAAAAHPGASERGGPLAQRRGGMAGAAGKRVDGVRPGAADTGRPGEAAGHAQRASGSAPARAVPHPGATHRAAPPRPRARGPDRGRGSPPPTPIGSGWRRCRWSSWWRTGTPACTGW